MKRTREEAEQTRQNLVDAGLRIMNKKGFSSTRIEDIASEAGVTRGAFYYHFSGKEEIYFELLHKVEVLMCATVDTARQAPLPTLERMRKVLYDMFHLLVENEEFRDILNVVLRVTEQRGEIGARNRAWVENYMKSMIAFRPLIVKARKQGEINPEMKVDDIIDSFFTAVTGVLEFTPLHRSNGFSVRKVYAIADVFIRGIQG